MRIIVLTSGDADRRESISNQLKDIDFEFMTTPPQDNLINENNTYKNRQLSFQSRPLSIGQFAAWKAHYLAWEMVSKSLEPALIIEDNALIHYKTNLHKLNIEIIKYGVISFSETGGRESIDSTFKKENGFLPLYSYGITPYFADMLMNRANKNGFSIQVDTWLTKYKLCGTYSFCSNIVISSRMPRKLLKSIAQQNIPKKSKNIYYKIIRLKNKKSI